MTGNTCPGGSSGKSLRVNSESRGTREVSYKHRTPEPKRKRIRIQLPEGRDGLRAGSELEQYKKRKVDVLSRQRGQVGSSVLKAIL